MQRILSLCSVAHKFLYLLAHINHKLQDAEGQLLGMLHFLYQSLILQLLPSS